MLSRLTALRRVLTVCACLMTGPVFHAATETSRKPNIVLILADDLGYGELGVQGYRTDIPTPNIDSLARNGVRFTQGYVSAPLCSPTRAGLMTGRYQQRYGVESNESVTPESGFGLPRAETTLAERLKAMGYVTGIFGKWHLGLTPECAPQKRGFDEFFGFLRAMHPYLPDGNARAPILRGSTPVAEKDYLTDVFAREAVGFIERHKTESFFLYLPFNAVHSPLQATGRYLNRFSQIRDPNRRTFAAMLAALDDAVGRVLHALDEHKLVGNTLIFFLSDNGGPTEETTSSNGPLRGGKAEVYEGAIRVPFIVQWTGRLPAGKVVELPVTSLDVHPTAVVAAGGAIRLGWNLDGVNLLPYLRGEKSGPPHDALFWRMGERHAVRDGDWKLVVELGASRPALFDLAHDPGERSDLAQQFPDTVKRLSAKYETWNAQMAQPTRKPQKR